MNKLFAIGIALLFALPVWSQEVAGETWLEEVEILGAPPEKYAAGSRIASIDSVGRVLSLSGSLGTLLSQNSSLYFREYGQGMLSTVSFRGTSASQTAVLWNGLNLNSMTLGSTDFSNLPAFMFDEVYIHHGSGSALYGSDAVGGSVVLQSHKEAAEGLEVQLLQTIGSFGQRFSGLKSSYGKGSWSGSTTVYHQRSQNDFPFINTTKYGNPEERQQNASVRNYGLMQSAAYDFNSSKSLSLHAWYEDNDNDIQPTAGNNLNPKTYEHIRDRHHRIALTYQSLSSRGQLRLLSGYVRDHQVYNRQAPIATSRWIAQGQYEKTLGASTELKAGGQWQHIRPEVKNYPAGLTQQRYDLFASASFTPYTFWELSMNARQAFVTGFKAPFTPSLGSALVLFTRKNAELTLKKQAGRSYRIPTFNDLYWQPGGNPQLRPEHGWSLEGGLQYKQQRQHLSLAAEATYYRMWLDDLILWQPAGTVWSPRNVREVLSQGLEFSSSFTWKKQQQHFRADLQYALTASVSQTALSEYDRSAGRQLPYIPRHRVVMNMHYQWQAWAAGIHTTFTSRRYTSPDYLQAYSLTHIFAERSFHCWGIPLTVNMRINNLLDASYENMSNRAMPGKNYQLSILVNFSNTINQP